MVGDDDDKELFSSEPLDLASTPRGIREKGRI